MSVEACLTNDTCSPFTKCPKTASRDCLRASVPFRTPLQHLVLLPVLCQSLALCYKTREEPRRGRRRHAPVSDSASVRYSKPNPDSGISGHGASN